MWREVAFVAVLAAVALARPYEKLEDIPEEYRALIPAEVVEKVKSITPEEREILKEVAKNYASYKNENEFLDALKAKSEPLYEKAKSLQDFVVAKVNKLSEEPKNFVLNVLKDAREVHANFLAGNKPTIEQGKKLAQTHLAAFNALSDGAKAEFKENFPLLTNFFTNPKVKALIEKYVN